MDQSLDDYISKSDFKVQIGNPNFKANKPKKFVNQFNKITGPSAQITPLANVSVTVPAVQKSPGNINKTNQIRDARERILTKGNPQDARQKIHVRPQGADFQITAPSGDARQKLTKMRSQAGPQDARAKLQAKKQQQQQQAQQTVPGPGGFMLTRTVSNNSGVQQHSPAGNFQVTKTLTKIMPPGYEGLVDGPPPPQHMVQPMVQPVVQPVQPIQVRQSVKQRLGQRRGSGPPRPVSVTRTVSTNLPFPGHPPPGHPVMDQRPPAPMGPPFMPPPPQQTVVMTHPPPHFPPNSPPVRYAAPPIHNAGAAPIPHPVQQGGQVPPHGPPPVGHAPPPRHYAPPHQQHPPPPQAHGPPPRHQGPPIQLHGPPPPQQIIAPPPQGPPPTRVVMTIPNPQPPRPEGPPYPVDNSVPKQPQEVHRPPMPVIQVQNDQYRPPQQQQQQYPHYAPPTQPYQAPPTQSYPPPQQPYTYIEATPPVSYQQDSAYTQRDTTLRRTIPNRDAVKSEPIIKTIVNETVQKTPERSSPPPLKRKSPGGPLKLSSTNTIPVLAMDVREESSRSSVNKYSTKSVTQGPDEPVIKKAKAEPVAEEVISPIQGYKIVISNLHVTVSQDDIIELFGAIGAVKKVKLAKPGTAEVHYVKKEDALQAQQTYHERELDGQPMAVKLVTPATAKVKEPPEKLPPSVKPLATGPLKLSKKPAGMAKVSEKKGVDVVLLHKALFKTGSSSSSKPVTFTVNI